MALPTWQQLAPAAGVAAAAGCAMVAQFEHSLQVVAEELRVASGPRATRAGRSRIGLTYLRTGSELLAVVAGTEAASGGSGLGELQGVRDAGF